PRRHGLSRLGRCRLRWPRSRRPDDEPRLGGLATVLRPKFLGNLRQILGSVLRDPQSFAPVSPFAAIGGVLTHLPRLPLHNVDGPHAEDLKATGERITNRTQKCEPRKGDWSIPLRDKSQLRRLYARVPKCVKIACQFKEVEGHPMRLMGRCRLLKHTRVL